MKWHGVRGRVIFAALCIGCLMAVFGLPKANAQPNAPSLVYFPLIMLSGPIPSATDTPAPGAILFAGGDSRPGDDEASVAVAALLDSSSPYLHVGDFVDSGTTAQFASYDTVWGTHKSQTWPVPGNHEYGTSGASGYFAYFGERAGTAGKGWYSFDYGGWHIAALNTELAHSAGSEQELWLKADLAAHPILCTIAFWHEPRFSSGEHGNDTSVGPLWNDLYAAGAELVFNGHDHNYERFAPQNPSGGLDVAEGIREFVVGTAGVTLRSIGALEPNSEVSNDDTHGLLKLTLQPTGYTWEFIPVAGGTFTDSGSGTCH